MLFRSSWFSWRVYHKGKLALKTFLIILNVLIGIFTIPQFAIRWPALAPFEGIEERIIYLNIYWFVSFAGSIVCFVFYGIFENMDIEYSYLDTDAIQKRVWLLICGLYFLVWCLFIDIIFTCNVGVKYGALKLPVIIFKKVKRITTQYNVGTIDDIT